MKKLLFVAIMFCMTTHLTYATDSFTEKPKIEKSSDTNDGWESMGMVTALNNSKTKKTPVELYMKVISGVKYYKIKYNNDFLAVIKNPKKDKNYKYRAGDFYLNI